MDFVSYQAQSQYDVFNSLNKASISVHSFMSSITTGKQRRYSRKEKFIKSHHFLERDLK